MIVWGLLSLILLAVAVGEIYNFKTGVPTVSSFPSARRKIVETIKQHAPPGAVIMDLGSGTGRLSWAIARALPQAEVIGIEISFFPWLISVLRQKLTGTRNLRYRRADFWSYDCATVDVMVTYLTENIIERVGDKLRDEMKVGALIVANDTALRGDWQPVEVIDTGFLHLKLYLYRQSRDV